MPVSDSIKSVPYTTVAKGNEKLVLVCSALGIIDCVVAGASRAGYCGTRSRFTTSWHMPRVLDPDLSSEASG